MIFKMLVFCGANLFIFLHSLPFQQMVIFIYETPMFMGWDNSLHSHLREKM